MEQDPLDVEVLQPDPIPCGAHVFDIAFHPEIDIVAASLVTGAVELYSYDKEGGHARVLDLSHHTMAARTLSFSPCGTRLVSGAKDQTLVAVDVNGEVGWQAAKAHPDAINKVHCVDTNMFVSGDDAGGVRVWDMRQSACTASFKEQHDVISDMVVNSAGNKIIASSCDATLALYNIRMGKMEAKSEDQEDELLSLCLIKGGNTIVCGTQEGVLDLFAYGDWEYAVDKFPGHPQSVQTMLKIDEDTILTGSSDGIIRILSLGPNKLLGVIGDHEEFPVEVIALSRDRQLIGSCSHDSKVHFWDVSYLNEDGAGGGDEEDGAAGGGAAGGAGGAGGGGGSSSSSAAAAAGETKAAGDPGSFFDDL